MDVRRVQFAFTSLIVLVTCIFALTVASAQSAAQQCTWLQQKLTESLNANSVKNVISLERQYLTYCKDYLRAEQFALELAILARALNDDKEHQDALGVANRWLQVNSTELACLFEEADALSSLGRLREAKSVIERSLTLGAITEIDAAAKRYLQNLLLQVNARTSLVSVLMNLIFAKRSTFGLTPGCYLFKLPLPSGVLFGLVRRLSCSAAIHSGLAVWFSTHTIPSMTAACALGDGGPSAIN
jgi:tetratricopeptide (TPR) repeat protein